MPKQELDLIGLTTGEAPEPRARAFHEQSTSGQRNPQKRQRPTGWGLRSPSLKL